MISRKGRKVTRPGGMTGASSKGVKVNVPSSNYFYPAFYYSLSAPVCLLDEEGGGSSAHTLGAPAHAGQQRGKSIRRNSISYRSHRVKVEGQIVQSVEDAGERFLRRHQVA